MRQLTLSFEDENLYAAVNREAARRGLPAEKIVAEILREWLEAQEDAALLPEIEAARKEWEEQGGVEAGEFFRVLRQ